jgi:hypothetical protein
MACSMVNFTITFTITYLNLVHCHVRPTRALPNSYVISDLIAENIAFMLGDNQSSLMDVYSTLKLTAAYLSEM